MDSDMLESHEGHESHEGLDSYEARESYEEHESYESPESFASHYEPDGDLNADLNDTACISCPYCREARELHVDLTGGAIQEYVEDCQVCCRPWLVLVQLDAEGYAAVEVTTLDNE